MRRALVGLGFVVLAAGCLPVGDQRYVYAGDNGSGYSKPGFHYAPSRAYRNDDYRDDRRAFRAGCDARRQLCFKDGRIDKSETRDVFGDRAAERVKNIRDRRNDNDDYRDGRSGCDDRRQVCLKNGQLDRSETRERYGDGR